MKIPAFPNPVRMRSLVLKRLDTALSQQTTRQSFYAEVYYAKQISADIYAAAENLKWIQTSVAGIEGFWYPQIR
jgi:phosphoglycerate dehydrogenase-like enzyme